GGGHTGARHHGAEAGRLEDDVAADARVHARDQETHRHTGSAGSRGTEAHHHAGTYGRQSATHAAAKRDAADAGTKAYRAAAEVQAYLPGSAGRGTADC